jgi:hypothetical protein
LKRNLLNLLLVVLFLAVMNYPFTGNRPHEVLGMVLFFFILWHNGLNIHGYQTFFTGRRNIYWILLTIVNFLLVIAFLLSMVSGILISQLVMPSMALHGTNTLWVHSLHQGSSYACFLLLGIHLGFHWEMIWVRLSRRLGLELYPQFTQYMGYILAFILVIYGMEASFANHIGDMLLMKHVFGILRVASPEQFFIDFLGILGCYTVVTHYGICFLKSIQYK